MRSRSYHEMMLLVEITLSNYRSFDDTSPARWTLADGFTAFVGVNNAGKSSLLRFFHEIRPCFSVLSGLPDSNPARQAIGGTPYTFGFQSVADPNEVFCNRNEREMTARFVLPAVQDQALGIEPSAITFRWHRSDAGMTVEIEVDGRSSTTPMTFENRDFVRVQTDAGEKRVNIARYRDTFQAFASSIYLGPFRNAVNLGANASYYDLRIGQAFIAQWDQFKTGPNRQQNRMAIAVERELQQVFGLSNLEINAAPGDSALQVIADDQPYQLQEQGAGLAQFIVVMAFIATQHPAYVFIDEPELNLHPSLQLDFLTTLAKYCDRGVAFSTHSIGLARAVAERVYSVRRRPDESREVRPLEATNDIVEFLGELGFSGYQELGFDRVLLVEGPSEIPTIQQWLRLYGVEHRIVLVPLGGSSMINGKSGAALSEINRITTNVSVLIDGERTATDTPLGAERRAFVEACERLGFDVQVLERRSLENYLTDAAVQSVKGPKYTALTPFQARGEKDAIWGKNENWRIAAEMTREDLQATDLGPFFERLANSVTH